jgi:hypothetical protein
MELNDIVEWRGNYYHLRAINEYNLKNGECKIQLLGPLEPPVISNLLPEKDCGFNFTSSLINTTSTTSTTSTTTAPPDIFYLEIVNIDPELTITGSLPFANTSTEIMGFGPSVTISANRVIQQSLVLGTGSFLLSGSALVTGSNAVYSGFNYYKATGGVYYTWEQYSGSTITNTLSGFEPRTGSFYLSAFGSNINFDTLNSVKHKWTLGLPITTTTTSTTTTIAPTTTTTTLPFAYINLLTPAACRNTGECDANGGECGVYYNLDWSSGSYVMSGYPLVQVQNLSGSATVPSPFNSPISSAPITCTPIRLKSFQIQIGGQNIFSESQSFNYQFYNNSALSILGDVN